MDARIAAEHYESIMSNIDPLLEEGHEITIKRSYVKDEGISLYVVFVSLNGIHKAAGNGRTLSEAMASVWEMTPETKPTT